MPLRGPVRKRRPLRARTKLIASFAHPLHLERFVIGKLMEVDWIKLPVALPPRSQPDTII